MVAKAQKNNSESYDVLVIGGGNAALCAALSAREQGASVLILESAPKEWRGGNSAHTRNLRCMHNKPQDVLVDSYPEEEFWQDLRAVTGGHTNEKLARMVIRSTEHCRKWMRKHGVNFQASLSGSLQLSRTNAFFMGGGKALVNAYFRSAENMGVQVRYNSPVDKIEMDGSRFVAAYSGNHKIYARSCVLAAGGFESNLEWLREAWGQNERGEWPAENFLIRGTRFNQGVLLREMLDMGADGIGEPSQSHCVAIDARAPLYDGGICTRIDCVSLGIVVNREGHRFHDEGEDFWPKRYAIWGRLVANQPGQIAYSIIDSKVFNKFMPPVFPSQSFQTIAELAEHLGLDPQTLTQTIEKYNAACQPGTFDHNILDDCHTQGLKINKTHWAQPIDTPPYKAYPLRPGITFTYLGLKVNEHAAVHFDGIPSNNLFVAGEMMAGNILGKGYIAGVGMSIGTVFGRIAGTRAAEAALAGQINHLEKVI